MNVKKITGALAILAIATGAGIATAAPTLCSDTADGTTITNPDGLSVADVTFRSNPADDCYGVVAGNDTAADIDAIGAWGTDWALAARDNIGGADVSNTIDGINFVITATAGTSGTWTLTWTDTNGGAPLNFPTNFDFVVVPKASVSYAAYFFDDELLAASPNSGTGTFTIAFLNLGGQIPNLSHLSIYGRSDSDGGGGEQQIPEPGTLALLGIALLGGLATIRRRSGRNRKAA